MSKRNLDELFRERLQTFSEAPQDHVWKGIESALDQRKKKRRAVPIWWTLGGVAALLAVFLLLKGPAQQPLAPSQTVGGEQTPAASKSVPQEETKKANSALEEEGADDGSVQLAGTNQESEGQPKAITPQKANSSLSAGQKHGLSQEALAANGAAPKDGLENPKTGNASESNNAEANSAPENQGIADVQPKTAPSINTPKQDQRDAVAQEEPSQQAPMVEQDTVGKKSIYDAIAENEEEEEKEPETGAKWAVGPTVAPVYYNSFGGGSPIDPSFSNNTRSGTVNLSYGLAVSYAVNKKLRIRSGLNKVDFGYDTHDISFSPSLNAANLNNVKYDRSSENIVVENTPKPQNFADKEASSSVVYLAGDMSQKLGYLELPVELNYALVNHRFGVDLIGGFSSLFLLDNSVSLESNGRITELGEANNLNPFHLSTNVGIGVRYNLTQKMQLNLEPKFKYHLNTFSNAAEDFKPYSVGVYSGLIIKF